MRRLGLLLACLSFTTLALALDAERDFTDPELQQRYETLAQELRCPKCQNNTIADSNAPIAADLRRALRDQLGAGRTDEEILKFMTDRYGDFVLYRPPFDARTWLLWLAPGLLLLAGLISAAIVIARKARAPIPEDTDTGTDIA